MAQRETETPPQARDGVTADTTGKHRTCASCYRPFMAPCSFPPPPPEPLNYGPGTTVESWSEQLGAAYRERRALVGSVAW